MRMWDSSRRPWSVVLAGGDGERIRPFIEYWLGRHRPKQYCTFVGTRSLLQHTIDRADHVSSQDHRVTVAAPESRFVLAVTHAISASERAPERPILLGATPDRPEHDYGWIVAEAPDAGATDGVRRVRAFKEKPRPTRNLRADGRDVERLGTFARDLSRWSRPRLRPRRPGVARRRCRSNRNREAKRGRNPRGRGC
jgi:mannose-1-phosphate guanylyltransferase